MELFYEGFQNLSTLVLMRTHVEIRNYVTLLTTILNRLYTEDNKTAFDLQLRMRNKLISVVQSLSFSDQEELTDIVSMLKDLLNKTDQLIPQSSKLVLNFVKSVLKETAGRIPLQRKLTESLILLASSAAEESTRWLGMENLFMEGMDSIRDLILEYITLNSEHQFNLSTSFLELRSSMLENCQSYNQTIGPSMVHLPKLLDKLCTVQNTSSMPCYISYLMYFKKKLYISHAKPSELDNGITSLNLFDCSSRRQFKRNLATPVIIEIDGKRSQSTRKNRTIFSLFRSKIHFHYFNTTTDGKHSALRIMVTFRKPQSRAFPVLLLIRYSRKPTPFNFNLKQVHYLEENTTQIFISSDAIKKSGLIYLALMDADYKRNSKNNYISKFLQYTVDIQWIQCLSWFNKHWNSEDCYPQKGYVPSVTVCSCTRLGLYTTANRQVLSLFDVEDVSQFISTSKNTSPCIVIVSCAFLYILLMIFGTIKARHENQKDAFVYLQDNAPSDRQQYAVMVDVGFRSRAKSTAKVYIVLHGEDGVSETRELYCPDRPVFERNSRHIFIMSVPANLGPIWKIHIWHNNIGHSPSLYLSHVIVKDLKSMSCWFFYAECWLAVDEGDGKVERELTCATHGLGFKRLFYCKVTQYLEDFHSWFSVFSQTSYSCFTQRITTCFVLCLGYMCVNIILINSTSDQYTAENGLFDFSTTSLCSGFQVTLAVYPIALLLSFLFKYSKKLSKHVKEHSKVVKIPVNHCEGQHHYAHEANPVFESSLTWQNFQYWAYDAWKKKYQRDASTSSILYGDCSIKRQSSSKSSTQSSDGFEDLNCDTGRHQTTVLKNMKACTNGSCLLPLTALSLGDTSFFNKYKVLPAWCIYLVWSLCAAFSLAFGTISLIIGFRLNSTKCILWLHAVFFSIVCCIFIVQPFLVFTVPRNTKGYKDNGAINT
ncbi:polycystin-1-like protein 1 [Hyperolius riggenbachi]|uniref:polycystin-1-like protein 1 n=1 Tax=Hyperolius riggenbachi TaxID=752182 RepID=UPI0035A2AE5A